MAHRTVTDRGKSSVVPLVVVSVIVLGLGGVVALMFEGQDGRRRSSSGVGRQGATISNAKQLAIATIMYATDYDERYPLGMSGQHDFERALMPYTKNASVFRTLNPAGGGVGSQLKPHRRTYRWRAGSRCLRHGVRDARLVERI